MRGDLSIEATEIRGWWGNCRNMGQVSHALEDDLGEKFGSRGEIAVSLQRETKKRQKNKKQKANKQIVEPFKKLKR